MWCRLTWLAVAVSTSALLAAPAAADSDSSTAAAAEARFQEGRELMAQGRYAEACARFDTSYELEPLLGSLLNRAACREKNGQTATAWALYHEALASARRERDPKREAFARERAVALEPSLRYVTISVDEKARLRGLTITRNAAPVDPSLWNQRLPIDPGEHELRVMAPGWESYATHFKLEDRDLEISIPRLTAKLEPSTRSGKPGAAKQHGMRTGRKIAIGTGALAVASLVGGGLFALRSQSKTSDAEQLCTDDFQCTPRGVTLVDQARTAANLSYVSYGVGAAAAITATVLWFTSARTVETSTKAARLVPALAPGSVGLDLQGRF